MTVDGTLIACDRAADDPPFRSGKHRHHGVNIQVVADPAGDPVWVSGPCPTRRNAPEEETRQSTVALNSTVFHTGGLVEGEVAECAVRTNSGSIPIPRWSPSGQERFATSDDCGITRASP
ncbi:transposase family protein [Halostreptopolyspora alba]|uniref:transposase family protein n=1 Tax=Halostreptopolyspora alba TaxID=2487137 RepID=UPI0011CDB353